ncbi:alpha/beta fold hydrolase [Rhodococcus sp. T2V]|uniref:alpha/beta fold hydrolase n=1 Tax=Rhodococcus sp. T2V TaxID=3034164 RepID=UPI0023E0F8AB|nr:alpha/beta fold hydrolase [Rhodococcus sp. T2V]MDF3311448.1 alpha/beta fold hydrolase [Rhodococcus sp. T2V]
MPATVLIHGGFHGSWCWDKVRPLLEDEGWTVYAPSLTGLGDRAYLASPDVTLRTHVQDVVNLIAEQDLTDVALCGHSAAGMVITGVADAIPERIATLVYLDAVLPSDGESMFDIAGHDSPMIAAFTRQAAERGDGWLVPPDYFSAADFGVTNPTDVTWVEQNLTGHPIRAFSDPLSLTGAGSRIANKIYVRCTDWKNRTHLDRALAAVESDPAWTVYRWPSVHDVMITEPDRVRELFAWLAAATGEGMP